MTSANFTSTPTSEDLSNMQRFIESSPLPPSQPREVEWPSTEMVQQFFALSAIGRRSVGQTKRNTVKK